MQFTSFLVLAFVLAVVELAKSHPIQTSKWVKTPQIPGPNPSRTRRVIEKERYALFPNPTHVRYYQNQIWQKRWSNKPTEQEALSNRYAKEIPELGKPTVSVLVPERITGQLHQSLKHIQEEHRRSTSEEKEESSNAIHAVDIQRQYLHTKHALDTKHKGPTYASSLSFSSLGLNDVPSPRHRFSDVSTTVIILLVVVWIGILGVGIAELGSYLWRWRVQMSIDERDAVGHIEERDVGLDEDMKIPLEVVAAPSEYSWLAVTGHGYEVLNAVPSDSGLESDEDYDHVI
ncbi:hypothetical protein N7461_000456 [Penicillium sp. DV-2018c]|nr:hypothetical protein N7461_000456 [Penicillium sp. DV-2018c]